MALVRRRASTHTHMHTWSPLTHTHTRTQVHAYTQARMHTPAHTCTVRVRPIRNTSYIYAHTKNCIRALKCRSQQQLQLYILRLLVNVCQWYDSDVILLWPVHECVVICRKRRTQQTVTARSFQKNAGAVDSFTWLCTCSPASSRVALMASHRLIQCVKKIECFKDDSQQQQQEILIPHQNGTPSEAC